VRSVKFECANKTKESSTSNNSDLPISPFAMSRSACSSEMEPAGIVSMDINTTHDRKVIDLLESSCDEDDSSDCSAAKPPANQHLCSSPPAKKRRFSFAFSDSEIDSLPHATTDNVPSSSTTCPSQLAFETPRSFDNHVQHSQPLTPSVEGKKPSTPGVNSDPQCNDQNLNPAASYPAHHDTGTADCPILLDLSSDDEKDLDLDDSESYCSMHTALERQQIRTLEATSEILNCSSQTEVLLPLDYDSSDDEAATKLERQVLITSQIFSLPQSTSSLTTSSLSSSSSSVPPRVTFEQDRVSRSERQYPEVATKVSTFSQRIAVNTKEHEVIVILDSDSDMDNDITNQVHELSAALSLNTSAEYANLAVENLDHQDTSAATGPIDFSPDFLKNVGTCLKSQHLYTKDTDEPMHISQPLNISDESRRDDSTNDIGAEMNVSNDVELAICDDEGRRVAAEANQPVAPLHCLMLDYEARISSPDDIDCSSASQPYELSTLNSSFEYSSFVDRVLFKEVPVRTGFPLYTFVDDDVEEGYPDLPLFAETIPLSPLCSRTRAARSCNVFSKLNQQVKNDAVQRSHFAFYDKHWQIQVSNGPVRRRLTESEYEIPECMHVVPHVTRRRWNYTNNTPINLFTVHDYSDGKSDCCTFMLLMLFEFF
jgi:hypothetical protein